MQSYIIKSNSNTAPYLEQVFKAFKMKYIRMDFTQSITRFTVSCTSEQYALISDLFKDKDVKIELDHEQEFIDDDEEL